MKWYLFLLVFVVACTSAQVPELGPEIHCQSDVDCVAAGCSGQICVPAYKAADIVTTCEYLEEYICYQEANCGCVQGVCSWPKDINTCLEQYR